MRNVLITTLLVCSLTAAAPNAAAQSTFCQVPSRPPAPPAPPTTPSICDQNPECHLCDRSPCYVATGTYTTWDNDLTIRTMSSPISVTRHYDTGRLVDGPLGIGWMSSLTPRLYLATYLFSAPASYRYEAQVFLPNASSAIRFGTNPDGTFFPPPERRDTLVRNGDGTFLLTLQRSRASMSFNVDGTLSRSTDDFGNHIDYTYDANGRIQRIADGSGSARYVDITWGPDGRISTVTDSFTPARQVKYFYDSAGTLRSVSDPIVASDPTKRSRYYTYDAGRFGPMLSRIEDRWNRLVSRIAYTADGKVQSYTDGDYVDGNPPASTGEKYTYSYFPTAVPKPQTAKTNSLGSKLFTYTTNGLVQDRGVVTTLGQVTSTTNDAGNTTSFTYDGRGNVSQMTRAGVTWTYTYDATFPDQVSTVKSSQPSKWSGFKYEYFGPTEPGAGAVKHILRYRTDGVTLDYRQRFSYDAHGRVTFSGDQNNETIAYAYNATGDQTSQTVQGVTTTAGYDSLGRMTRKTAPGGHDTIITYDVLDRPKTITLPRPTAASALNFTITFDYDMFDPATGLVYNTTTDQNGRVTSEGRDALGHVIESKDALGNVTRSTYQYNLLRSVTDPNGNTVTYSYDQRRQVQSKTFPDGTAESYGKFEDGTLAYVIDRRGQTISFSRDAMDRVTTVSYGNTASETYSYDGENLTDAYDGTAQFHYTYDSAWRRVTDTRLGFETVTVDYGTPQTDWAPTRQMAYTIAPAAGQTGPTLTVSNGYDLFGRINQMHWSAIAAGDFTFTYAPHGELATITYPNGQTRTYSYDDQSRLTRVANQHPAAGDLAVFDYGYDQDWNTNTPTMLGQRTSVSTAPGSLTKYFYDPNYQLTKALEPSGTFESWAYDAVGNRISRNFNAGGFNYTYYKNGSNTANGYRLKNDGSQSADYVYDAAGSLTGTTAATQYTWNYANRLIANAGVTYTYDFSGRRLSSTVSGLTTRYVTFLSRTIAERGARQADYVYGPGIDLPLAKRAADGSIVYYSADGLGSIVAASDPSAGSITRFTYGGYGALSQPSSELFGYTGRESGPGTLWYYRARYYQPASGRFISEDPAGMIEGLNPYRYVKNDPANLTDPSGMQARVSCSTGWWRWVSSRLGSPQSIPKWVLIGAGEPGVPLFSMSGDDHDNAVLAPSTFGFQGACTCIYEMAGSVRRWQIYAEWERDVTCVPCGFSHVERRSTNEGHLDEREDAIWSNPAPIMRRPGLALGGTCSCPDSLPQ
jgi:RHS repeat-associated protein